MVSWETQGGGIGVRDEMVVVRMEDEVTTLGRDFSPLRFSARRSNAPLVRSLGIHSALGSSCMAGMAHCVTATVDTVSTRFAVAV